MTFKHTPVLLTEVLEVLQPASGKSYMDCTLGGGGHTRAIWQRIQPGGQLIGLDQDIDILAQTRQRLVEEGIGIQSVHCRFDQLRTVLNDLNIEALTGGLLADLGVSSFQLDDGSRGFSFNKAADLDMRMNTTEGITAADVVNTYSETDLVRIFSDYGEERLSKTIARVIVSERKKCAIVTTTQLAALVTTVYEKTLGQKKNTRRVHPATCVFQALRIEVNDELGALERLLAQLPECLAYGAIAVFISFHSLEDRIVKRALRDLSKPNDNAPATFQLVTKKPIIPTAAEVKNNPRARSAKLRAVIKL